MLNCVSKEINQPKILIMRKSKIIRVYSIKKRILHIKTCNLMKFDKSFINNLWFIKHKHLNYAVTILEPVVLSTTSVICFSLFYGNR